MQKKESVLDKEQHRMRLFSPALLVSIGSGFITFLTNEYSVWQQWFFLIHIFSGVLVAIVFIPYLYAHIKRILGNRRLFVFITGIFAAFSLIGLIATGTYISILGQNEAQRWIYDWHILSSYLLLATLLFHILFHCFSVFNSKRGRQQVYFQSIPREVQRLSVFSLITTVICVFSLTALYASMYTGYLDQGVVQNYEYPYGAHPFRPSQTETLNQSFVDEKRIGGSFKCGSCHEEITKQWMASIHSQGASDLSYVKNVNLLAKKKGISATRYCEGCHAPIALLTGQLSTGGKHGGIQGTTAFNEGISCMGCHGIEEAVHLKGVASYRFVAPKEYLFGGADNWFAKKIHNYLIKTHPEQHRKDMARNILSSPKLCATCHVQFMDKEVNNWGWVKMQDEYSAWLASSFSSQTEQSFADEKVQRCQDCHLPLKPGVDPSADENGRVVSHRTLAANTVIPWVNGDTEQFVQTQEFLKTGKIKVTIEEPRKTDAIQSDFFVEESIRSSIETPSYLYLGDNAAINVIVSNTLVGHNFPGGSTDINEVWIEFRIVDAQNKVVFSSGSIDDDGEIDRQAHFYRAIPVDRFGKHVWRHDLFNMVGNAYESYIPPGKSDIVSFQFTVPYWAQSPLIISAVVRYRKFNNRYAHWVFDSRTIKLPITDVASDVITVPLKYKSPVTKS